MSLPRFDIGTLMLVVFFTGIAAWACSRAYHEEGPFAVLGWLLIAPPALFLMICGFLIMYYRKL